MAKGSFTAKIFIEGPTLNCGLGFERFEPSSYDGFAAGQVGYIEYTVPTVQKKISNYLTASTCNESTPAIFRFEPVNSEGWYIATSADDRFYKGQYLGINSDLYLSVNPYMYCSNFAFERGGKAISLSEMQAYGDSGLEMVCSYGGIELHDKLIIPGTNNAQWSAYIRPEGGNAGLVGHNIKLIIQERDT